LSSNLARDFLRPNQTLTAQGDLVPKIAEWQSITVRNSMVRFMLAPGAIHVKGLSLLYITDENAKQRTPLCPMPLINNKFQYR
jgi:hypothetical protein